MLQRLNAEELAQFLGRHWDAVWKRLGNRQAEFCSRLCAVANASPNDDLEQTTQPLWELLNEIKEVRIAMRSFAQSLRATTPPGNVSLDTRRKVVLLNEYRRLADSAQPQQQTGVVIANTPDNSQTNEGS